LRGAGARFALAPREAVTETEHLGVGETAGFVALQDHAAAARHQRDVVEQVPVLADESYRVTLLGAQAGVARM
jgi:hypothetical protein